MTATIPRGVRRPHRRRLGAAAATIWLAWGAAFSQPAELLNSQRIEQRFGSYGIAVLESDAVVRVSNLYSVDGGRQTCRTFAVVRYSTVVEPAFAREHARIVDGGSIGVVFAAAGWQVEKTHRLYGELPAAGRAAALMQVAEGTLLAAHVYSLAVVKDGARHHYATIAELHHPDYLSVDDLETIYGPAADDAAAAELLAVAAAKMHR